MNANSKRQRASGPGRLPGLAGYWCWLPGWQVGTRFAQADETQGAAPAAKGAPAAVGEEAVLPNSFVLSNSAINTRALQVRRAIFSMRRSPSVTMHRGVRCTRCCSKPRGALAGVLDSPAPYAIQADFSDFYVEYRLVAQAGPAAPAKRAQAMSDLHGNVQDMFNEYGVQIPSPHYQVQPPQVVTVPREEWYEVPAVKSAHPVSAGTQ